MFPGKGVVAGPAPSSWPPSWSAAINNGRSVPAASCNAAVSERRLRHRPHVAVAEEGDTRPVREHVSQPCWNLDTFEGGHERPLGAHVSP